MGKREKNQPVSWKSQLSPPSSHLSIAIAYFFYRCTAVRTSEENENHSYFESAFFCWKINLEKDINDVVYVERTFHRFYVSSVRY